MSDAPNQPEGQKALSQTPKKRRRAGCIIAALVAVALAVVVFNIRFSAFEIDETDDGTAFAKATVEALGQTWKFEDLEHRAYPGWLSVINPVATQQQLECFRQLLGPIRAVDSVSPHSKAAGKGPQFQTDVDIQAQFTLQRGRIRLRLLRPEGAWQVAGITIEPEGGAGRCAPGSPQAPGV